MNEACEVRLRALCNACAKAGRWQCAMSLLAQEWTIFSDLVAWCFVNGCHYFAHKFSCRRKTGGAPFINFVESGGLQNFSQELEQYTIVISALCGQSRPWTMALDLFASAKVHSLPWVCVSMYRLCVLWILGASQVWICQLAVADKLPVFYNVASVGLRPVQGQQAQDVVLLSALLKAVPWRRGHELLREAHDVADRQRLVCGAVMC